MLIHEYIIIAKKKKKVKLRENQKQKFWGVPIVAQRLTNPIRIYEDGGSIPGLARWVKDLALLWLWYMLAAVAPI